MALKDAFQDVISINSVSTGFKAGDTVGQTVKTFTPLYSNIKGRLNSLSNAALALYRAEFGKQEKFTNAWILQLEPQYNGGNRGDQVIANGEEFIITKKHEIRGRTPDIHHVVYYIEEGK